MAPVPTLAPSSAYARPARKDGYGRMPMAATGLSYRLRHAQKAEVLGFRLGIGDGGPRRWRHRYPVRASFTITRALEFRRLLRFQRNDWRATDHSDLGR